MAALPEKGLRAPEFALPDTAGALVELEQFRGQNLVLAFYPADWSPVCSTELGLIQETLSDVRRYGAEIVGISTDSPFSHRAFAEQMGLSFPLLSDFWPHGSVARRYGVFLDEQGISNRALFFVDGEGIVRDWWVAEHPGIAPGIGIVLATLREMEGLAEDDEALRSAPDRGGRWAHV